MALEQQSRNDSSPTRRGNGTAPGISGMMEQLAAAEGLDYSGITPTGRVPRAPKSCDSDVSSNTKAIASSSALVGETIMESHKQPPYQNARMQQLMMEDHPQTKTEWVAGKVNAGLGWIQKQRERRQREALERQVEEQRRILYEAQHGPSLSTNTAFASVSQQKSSISTSSIQYSQSGSGMQVDVLGGIQQEEEGYVPKVRLVEEAPEAPAFILSHTIMQLLLEQALPPSIAYSRWKRIYCLARDGDDFGEFLRRVEKQAHTLLVIRTTRDEIFGAYAESPWEPHHEGFYGSAQSCLFKVTSPEEVKVFKWTGANRYLQVCDANARMICFGGGGDAFGLCLEQDFSVGSTGACDTFGNEPLCDQENFEVVNVEAYGFLLGQF